MTAAELAVSECANHMQGRCLGERPCLVAQDEQCCGYFEAAVLPLHPEVTGYANTDPAPTPEPTVKQCERCGVEIEVGSNRARWCPECAAEVRREQTRLRVVRHRAVM